MTESVQNDPRRRQRFFLAMLSLFLYGCLSGSAGAQDPDEIVRIDTDLVSFEVTVTDKNGRLVPNLRREDFRLFEDGVERPIEFFQPVRKTAERRPLSVVFALDVSG